MNGIKFVLLRGLGWTSCLPCVPQMAIAHETPQHTWTPTVLKAAGYITSSRRSQMLIRTRTSKTNFSKTRHLKILKIPYTKLYTKLNIRD